MSVTSQTFILNWLCLQVPPGWPEHACSAGWWCDQGRRGAVVPSIPKCWTDRATVVSLWNSGEVLLQTDVLVWTLIHKSGGDHTCCSCSHSGTKQPVWAKSINSAPMTHLINLHYFKYICVCLLSLLSRLWRWVTSPPLWPVSCVWLGRLQQADWI